MLFKRPWVAWILLPVAFAAGFMAGRAKVPAPPEPSGQDYAIRQREGRLTNPLLDCEISRYPKGVRELRPFKNKLAAFVGRLRSEGLAERVSVYFRDLDNGPWYGVGEEKLFTPGSLYKVPVIIACLRKAQRDPSFLKLSVEFRGLPDPKLGSYHFPPAEQLEPGKSYTVEELVERTAVYSDNSSALLLQQTVDPALMSEVLLDLGIDPKVIETRKFSMSPSTFGRFFRILYNSSYLDQDMSELALSAFSRSTFREGLLAGVPEEITVAHKFGEYLLEEEGGRTLLQLHDGGIVYFPGRPYLLVVMTAGKDHAKLTEVIAQVSRFIFEEMSAQLLQERPAGSP